MNVNNNNGELIYIPLNEICEHITSNLDRNPGTVDCWTDALGLITIVETTS